MRFPERTQAMRGAEWLLMFAVIIVASPFITKIVRLTFKVM